MSFISTDSRASSEYYFPRYSPFRSNNVILQDFPPSRPSTPPPIYQPSSSIYHFAGPTGLAPDPRYGLPGGPGVVLDISPPTTIHPPPPSAQQRRIGHFSTLPAPHEFEASETAPTPAAGAAQQGPSPRLPSRGFLSGLLEIIKRWCMALKNLVRNFSLQRFRNRWGRLIVLTCSLIALGCLLTSAALRLYVYVHQEPGQEGEDEDKAALMDLMTMAGATAGKGGRV